jgi:hypothetical protein
MTYHCLVRRKEWWPLSLPATSLTRHGTVQRGKMSVFQDRRGRLHRLMVNLPPSFLSLSNPTQYFSPLTFSNSPILSSSPYSFSPASHFLSSTLVSIFNRSTLHCDQHSIVQRVAQTLLPHLNKSLSRSTKTRRGEQKR